MKQQYDAASSKQRETLKAGRTLGAAAWTIAVLGLTAGFVHAQNAPISLADRSFPESVTSTSDGALYVGSFNKDKDPGPFVLKSVALPK
ncbi:hypothetical protein [Bradyrhizobium sp. Ec3.3]|uniref:hypothetical protein n=1 Tax=Bradyrhizobium sp. Ec3.3 TaxID=189753 RepID=UPI000406DDE5|nr:hypothetical protein [Bradyrhizobium sp. Ec3.3]